VNPPFVRRSGIVRTTPAEVLPLVLSLVPGQVGFVKWDGSWCSWIDSWRCRWASFAAFDCSTNCSAFVKPRANLQPLPDIVLGLANKMSIFVVEKSVATLLAVERDNGPPVPHSNPGIILLVLEPVRVAWVTVRPRLDLMVKPPLLSQPHRNIAQPDGKRVLASLTLILLLPPSTCGHPMGAKLDKISAAFRDTVFFFIPPFKPLFPIWACQVKSCC